MNQLPIIAESEITRLVQSNVILPLNSEYENDLEKWHEILIARMNWLKKWNATLAPLFTIAITRGHFPIKAIQVNTLLSTWLEGEVVQLYSSKRFANSAALLLLGYINERDLTSATQAWIENFSLCNKVDEKHQLITECQVLIEYFKEWKRHSQEYLLLEQLNIIQMLTPLNQTRYEELKQLAWQFQNQAINNTNLRIALRERVDLSSLKRFFTDMKNARQMIIGLRAKKIVQDSEGLSLNQDNLEAFLQAIKRYFSEHKSLSNDYECEILNVTLTDTTGENNCHAVFFNSKTTHLQILLTVLVSHEAVLHLSTLVKPQASNMERYCTLVMEANDQGETPTEGVARSAIINSVVKPALNSLSVWSNAKHSDHFAG